LPAIVGGRKEEEKRITHAEAEARNNFLSE
jgi:hypothetical protein